MCTPLTLQLDYQTVR